MEYNKKIILEDGSEYYGRSFGADNERVCEIVFNTSMVGYQEIISDPSYTYQAVVMTYPLIGNYGINDDDFETSIPTIGGLIVREYNDFPSNFRSSSTLFKIMEKYHIPGIYGVDTRKITRSIRELGSRKVLITSIDTPLEKGLEILKNSEILHDAVSKVSTKQIWHSDVENEKYHVVAIDCGIKHNIIRSLNKLRCKVTIVPYNTTSSEIEKLNPDGIFISNGPGDPQDVMAVVNTLFTSKVEITSQNHSYAVDNDSLKQTDLEITHINLLDNTIEGVRSLKDKVFSVQYHPESAPGPQDSAYLFDTFIQLMEEEKNA